MLADEGRLRQILFNLAGNAVKFTETGGVLLQVERRERSATARLRFSVTDTGPGVPEAERERIFEAFAQADGGTAPGWTARAWAWPSCGGWPPPTTARVGLTAPPRAAREFWFEAAFADRRAGDARPGPLAGRTVAGRLAQCRSCARPPRGQIEAAGGRAVCADPGARGEAPHGRASPCSTTPWPATGRRAG